MKFMMRVFIEGEIEMQSYSLNKSKNQIKISEPEPKTIDLPKIRPPSPKIMTDEPIANNVEAEQDEYFYDNTYYEDGSNNNNNNHIKDDDYYDEEEEYYEEQTYEEIPVMERADKNVLNENGLVVTRACIVM
jgi:hypothetical protein